MKELNKILDKDEQVLWEGGPSFWPFLLGGSIITTIFGFFWLLFLLPFIGVALFDILFGSHVLGFGIFLLPHFWIGLILTFGIPIYQMLVYKHTYYAITKRRVILQKGLIGRDFEIVDFDQITNTKVNVGLFDKLFKGDTGSILISTAGSLVYSSQGTAQRPHVLRSITSPYEVFKLLEKVSYDIKTDIEYPNKLRPSANPGYKTDYKSTKN